MSGSLRALGFFAMATVSGSAALVGLYGLVRGYQERIDEMKRPEDTVMVIVAARDLYPGLPVEAEDLYAVQIPPKFLPEGVFLTPEHVVGRIPRERVLANDLVRAERLADPENGIGLETIIPRGLRAISVDLADGPALSGFLQPSSYVDVLATFTPEDEDAEPITRTLLQAVFVLGVDSRKGTETTEDAKERRGRNRPSVTLLVTSDQAEEVAHADVLGAITLSLRPSDDMTTPPLPGVDLDALRSKLAPKVKVIRPVLPPPPARECRAVRMIRGGAWTEQRVDERGLPCEDVPVGAGTR